jgi:hypothetical protein
MTAMDAILIGEEALLAQVRGITGELRSGDVIAFAKSHGQSLPLGAWEDGNFMLPGAVLLPLPDPAGNLLGVDIVPELERIDVPSSIGLLKPAECQALLEVLPEPDFDGEEYGVVSAREDLEQWLRRAVESERCLLLCWE